MCRCKPDIAARLAAPPNCVLPPAHAHLLAPFLNPLPPDTTPLPLLRWWRRATSSLRGASW